MSLKSKRNKFFTINKSIDPTKTLFIVDFCFVNNSLKKMKMKMHDSIMKLVEISRIITRKKINKINGLNVSFESKHLEICTIVVVCYWSFRS